MIIFKGNNEFNEGYIARVLEKPRNPQQCLVWQDGWDMAHETEQMSNQKIPAIVILEMIQLGQLFVINAPDKPNTSIRKG